MVQVKNAGNVRVVGIFRTDAAIINGKLFEIESVAYLKSFRPAVTAHLVSDTRVVFYIGIKFFRVDIQ